MASKQPVLEGRKRYFDANGKPLSGGLIYTYVSNTTIPLQTWLDAEGVTPNTNPIVLDNDGYASIFIGNGTYKFIVCDSMGAQIYTEDPIRQISLAGGEAVGAAESAAEAAIYAQQSEDARDISVAASVTATAAIAGLPASAEAAVEAALGDVGTRLDTVEITIASHTTQLADLGPRVTSAETNIGNLQSQVGNPTSSNGFGELVKRTGTGEFSATRLIGDVTGNVTGNVSGTALNVTGIVAKVNGGAGASMASVTFPTSGTLATTTGTQTFAAKTFSDSVIFTEIATPATPGAGLRRFYAKADGSFYHVGSDGIEKKVGSGSGGSTGFLYDDFETDISNWAVYNDGLGVTVPIDGTGGTQAGLTLSRSTVSPIDGVGSLLLSKGAVSIAGSGLQRNTIAVSELYRGRAVETKFPYKFSGTYADGTIQIYWYDITNSVLIPVTEGQSLLSSTVARDHYIRFQMPITCASGRLAFHMAGTDSNAWDLRLDNVNAGLQLSNRGDVIVEEFVYNSSGITAAGASNTTAFATGEVGATFGAIASSTTTVSTTSMRVQFSDAIRTTDQLIVEILNPALSGWQPVGSEYNAVTFTGQNTARYGIGTETVGANQVNVYFGNAGRVPTAAFGAAGAAWSDLSTWRWRVRRSRVIKNVAMSSEVSGRAIYENYTGNSGQALTNGVTNISFTNAVRSSGNWNGSEYEAKSSEEIFFIGHIYCSAALNRAVDVYINGVKLKRVSNTINDLVQHFSGSVFLSAGQKMSLRLADNNGTLVNDSVFHHVTIYNRAGSQQIAATERICATYGLTTAQAVTANGVIKYDTKVEDTHGLFSPSTGLFGPMNFTGKLEIKTVGYSGANGNIYAKRGSTGVGLITTVTTSTGASGTIEVPVSSGDYVGVYSEAAATFAGPAGFGFFNQVTFKRVT